MKKILITGAAGFIGSQLAYRLYKNGEDVLLVDDFSYGREDNLIFDDYDFSNEIFRKDIRDIEFMDELFAKNKFDVVYHFAGITPLPDCQNDPVRAVDVNVRGTTIILDLARKYGVGQVIFASTAAVYENTDIFQYIQVLNMLLNSFAELIMMLIKYRLFVLDLQMSMVHISIVLEHNHQSWDI